MDLVNQIVNAGIFGPIKPPRDSWCLGTVDGTPGALTADVILDGDTAASTMPLACSCADGDRVLTLLLGRSRIVVASLGAIAAIEDLIGTIAATVYAQDAEPSSGLKAGDLWFDTNDNNKPYRYSGAAFVSMRDGAIPMVRAGWTPSMSASGSMTVSSVVVDRAEYYVLGNLCLMFVRLGFTLGGTASNTVYFTLPTTCYNDATDAKCVWWLAYLVNPSTTGLKGYAYSYDATKFRVYREDWANWTLGAGNSILLTAMYEIA